MNRSRCRSRFAAALLAVTAAELLASVIPSTAGLVVAMQRVGGPAARPAAAPEGPEVSILVYHRFGPSVKDAMTVRTPTFRWQLDYLKRAIVELSPYRSEIALAAEGGAQRVMTIRDLPGLVSELLGRAMHKSCARRFSPGSLPP